MEHRIPELFFTNEEHPGEAVSAVKALAVAFAEGQRIYQITSENVGVVSSLNIGQEVKDEIIASVAIGQEATVFQSNITVAGWTGVGYIITDPETGAGAYRISGGSNGAILTIFLGALSSYLTGFTRFKDHWFNAGNAPIYAKISGILTVISALISVIDTLTNPKLSVLDKIKEIIVNIGAVIATIGISNAIMANAFLAASNPVLLGLLIATIAVTISILSLELLLYLALNRCKLPKGRHINIYVEFRMASSNVRNPSYGDFSWYNLVFPQLGYTLL